MVRISALMVAAIGLPVVIGSCSRKHEAGFDAAMIDSLLNAWHQAAAVADSTAYFALFDSAAVFIGTDPDERWTLSEFSAYVMPFFRSGRGWDFNAGERNYRSDTNDQLVWFDEKLDTWMGPCRSTGILQKQGSTWKLMHYHLAFTVPNEDIKGVLEYLDSTRVKD